MQAFWRAVLFGLSTMMVLAGSVQAQDEQGNDTPGNWVVTHQQAHGIWSTLCDERANRRDETKRCYIRWVDVFSPRPDFAALFLFVTSEQGLLSVEFGTEAGTLFDPNGFRIETMQGTSWSTQKLGCLTGLTCTFQGAEARTLLAAMRDGGAFAFDFVDRHGNRQRLDWPLKGFDAAMADFEIQRAARNLP